MKCTVQNNVLEACTYSNIQCVLLEEKKLQRIQKKKKP